MSSSESQDASDGDIEDLYSLLARRRMCRSYIEISVPRQALLRIVEAARRTPSAGHAQGVRFAVITSLEKRLRVARALGEESYQTRGFPPWLSSAPVHLLVGASRAAYLERYAEGDKASNPEDWPIDYGVLDGGKALMTLYLAAQREGLACGYLGPHRAQPVTEIFPWPVDWRFLGLVTVGYPDHARQRSSVSHKRGWRPLDSVVQWWDDEA